MSKTSLKRIKQIRQKTNNQSKPFNSIPLGVDGLLVDMMSNLDLEQDLKIGSNHYVQIQERDEEETLIKEYYFTQPKDTTEVTDMESSGKTTHKVEITISPFTYNFSYLAFDSENIMKIFDNEESSDAIIVSDDVDSSKKANITYITIVLFEYQEQSQSYSPHPIHSKYIKIEEFQNGYYQINEQVDLEIEEED